MNKQQREQGAAAISSNTSVFTRRGDYSATFGSF
jgi:hypothetical protein